VSTGRRRYDSFALAHKPIGTWIPNDDFIVIQRLAQRHNVSVSAYFRSIISDVIQEEIFSNKLKNTSLV
jgi:hypothetical protein